jgi:methionyl-tRNA formyltransferase
MKLGYFGTPDYSASLLRALYDSGYEISFVVTNPDQPLRREKKLSPPPVKEFALSKNIPVYQYESLKKLEEIEFFSHSADIYIVFAFGSLIPRKIFDHPLGGTMNLHGSLLPEFRGASPVQSALLAGYTETGVTLQYIVEELDAGDIIAQAKFPISIDDNFGTLLPKLVESSKSILFELLPKYDGNKFPASRQDASKASFCKKIKPEERKLNFAESAFSIHNKIRAYNPGNICFAEFRGKRINIYKARLAEINRKDLEFGTIFRIDKKTPSIVCGDGILLILEQLQLENKKVMSGLDFLNGSKLVTGEKFT